MTLPQGLAFGLVGLTVAAFVWGRFRYDLIALVALAAGLVIGVVPPDAAFDGLKNDVTVIIACALVVSAAFAKSGVVEMALRRILPLLKTEKSQVPFLTVVVTFLSMATKNVGALAIMLPVALQVCRKTGAAPSRLLMPMAFGAMVGGTATLVGTAPNIIVSEVRREMGGQPFGMFDYTPVGLSITVLALVFLALAYRLLPKSRQPAINIDAALSQTAYVTEVAIPEDWPLGPRRIGALIGEADGEVSVMALVRRGKRTANPHANTVLRPGDILLIEGEQQALDTLIVGAKLKLTRSDRPIAMEQPTEEVRVVEAVVGADSPLIGASARVADLHAQYGVNLLGVSRSGYRMTQQIARVRLKAGDVLLLQGAEGGLPAALQALDCLPLAEREVRLGGAGRSLAPAAILAFAMTLVALGVLPVAVAFFLAAVAMVVIGSIRMREAYAALDGPLLVLIAALIPVSEAIQSTGGSALIADLLSGGFRGLPPVLAVGGVMLASMAITPFLNNAATVLIVAPIGASLAKELGYAPDAFLMAVALGAACDFLTPIGHQCNTLVMAPGGYRFADYPRLGAPLSVLVLLAGPPLILLFWPL